MTLGGSELAALSRLLDTALDLPPAQRTAWLEALPPEDVRWRPRLAALLASPLPPPDALERLPRLAAAALANDRLFEPAPARDRVGPYRLVQRIGQGGMGEVWRAERDDAAFQRTVALKLPLAAAGAARLGERFARECDILAALEHPHIARLYDAGVGADGQPYLAMELVAGEPLIAHADRQRLGLHARIALMQQVLAAVQHAHGQLVVHRDIKPTNILVSAAGQATLLDFGIAQLMDADTGAVPPEAGLTQTGSSALTPTYAAPEQLMQRGARTASDLYSLGVVLYELLAGTSPYRPARPTRAALEEAVLHDDPLPPSKALTAAAADTRGASLPALRRQLRGDLDTIVLKALRKDPAQRYASADAFAQDLQRHLDGLPVAAHPAGLAYRAGKFLRRHRAASLAGAVATLALLAGTGLALWQARVAGEQALRARAEAAKAEAAQGFLVDLFDAADPARAQGREPSVRELMARAEQTLPQRLARQPELAGALRKSLVDIYLKLGEDARALPLAEAQVAELQRQPGADSRALGPALLQLAGVQSRMGRYEPAWQTAQQARAALQPHAADWPDLWLELPSLEATVLSALRQPDAAAARLEDLLPRLQARHGAQGWPLVEAQARLATARIQQGRPADAVALCRRIEPLLDRQGPERGTDVAEIRANLGYTLWLAGAWADARRSLERARGDFDRLQTPHNSNSIRVQRTLGWTLVDAGDYRAAAAVLDDNARRSARFHGATDGEAALDQSFRVVPLLMLGRVDEALAAATASVRVAEAGSSLTAGERRGLRRRLALAQLFAGQHLQALQALGALAAEDRAEGVRDGRAATTWWYLSSAQRLNQQPAAAADSAASAASVWRARPGASNQVLAGHALLSEALAQAAAHRPDLARARLADALQLLKAQLPAGHVAWLGAGLVRAALLRDEGQAAEARALEDATRATLAGDFGVRLPPQLPHLP